MGHSICPNHPVVGIAQPYILDVLSFVSGCSQPITEGWRQLRVDEDFHFASEKTA